MRALRTCDFCGADAVGTFELLPAGLEPSERERRRVVLCADCKHRLEDLLEPLLARLDDGGARADRAPADDDADADRPDGAPRRGLTDAGSATGSIASDSGADALAESVGSADDVAGDADEAAGESAEPNDEPTTGPAERRATPATDDRPNGVAVDFGSATDPDADGAAGAESAGDTESNDTGGDDTDADEAAATPDEAAAPDADPAARPPEVYANVIRLLRNREFPMERDAVESLAAGAYDLERHEVEAVIDHAIEREELVERDGTLDRP